MKTSTLNRMALSTQAIKLMKYLYWIVLTAAHLYMTYLLFVSNRAVTGVMWLIAGFFLIFIMYPYYFPLGDPGSQWPPYISACPDYLTRIAPNACVDYVGLNSNLLKKADPALPPALTDSTKVFDAGGSAAMKAARAQQYGLSWEGIA
jgi:hypothetical protein